MRVEERLARRGGWVECLKPLSSLYGAVVQLHGCLHDRRWLPSARLEVPVISVGNLTVGGTGKTPMVIWLGQELVRRGYRPGLLARGYSKEKLQGEDALNDEGRLIAKALPGIPQVQKADRVQGGHELVTQGCDVIVLDDGFQHRRLRRDLDLVLIDALRPWGLERTEGQAPVKSILPRGLLREKPSALGRANALLLTRTDLLTSDELAKLENELERDALGVPRLHAEHRPTGLRRIGDGASIDLDSLRGAEVELMSAIGNPAGFEQTVESLGATVAAHLVRPDHHDWSSADLRELGRGSSRILTTSKDAVKLEALGAETANIEILEIELVVTRGAAVLAALLDGLAPGRLARERDSLHEGLHG